MHQDEFVELVAKMLDAAERGSRSKSRADAMHTSDLIRQVRAAIRTQREQRTFWPVNADGPYR